jgi:hypothetical protein
MLMSRICSFVSLMGLFLCATAAQAAEPAPAAPGPATIEVTAKLINIPGKFPADELYDYVYVMQYEVQGGPMDKQKIYVAHYKPRRARAEIEDNMKKVVSGSLKRFEVGALHKLTLTAEMRKQWKGAVVDEFFDSDRKAKRYFCLKADPAGGK